MHTGVMWLRATALLTVDVVFVVFLTAILLPICCVLEVKI